MPTEPRATALGGPVRHGRQRRRGLVLPTIGGALTMALLLTGGYAAWSYEQLDSSLTKVHIAQSAADGSTVEDAADDADGKAQNILLIGDDHRPADATPQELAELSTQLDDGATNTDTMIVLHIPADGGSATMISFPPRLLGPHPRPRHLQVEQRVLRRSRGRGR
ncbi:hypothetical protein [Curtobacterium sp. MCJR17_043]|uniref:hypothetical protein n=1 Tax=Curtobacterium sp. MCJR17_043 TaxID=2175660 RepID=UPI0024DF4A1B|nr:hypothetical protein [Curtobacterium sp. MCJR17_043]WIB35683.1 hypothetical protein DEJ15_16310 [Curtobacterium sp. MCJR17_043]